MPRKNNFDTNDKTKVKITIPISVAEDIKATAEEMGVSMSYLYTQLITEGLSHYRTLKAVEEVKSDNETLYLAMELIGAKLDEIVKLFVTRLPDTNVTSEEEKDRIRAKAAKLSRNVANTACKAVKEFKTGDSDVDPLGVEKVLDSFSEYIRNAEEEKRESKKSKSEDEEEK